MKRIVRSTIAMMMLAGAATACSDSDFKLTSFGTTLVVSRATIHVGDTTTFTTVVRNEGIGTITFSRAACSLSFKLSNADRNAAPVSCTGSASESVRVAAGDSWGHDDQWNSSGIAPGEYVVTGTIRAPNGESVGNSIVITILPN